VTHHLHNDLEAGVGDQFPVIANIKAELLKQGAIGSLMTGSGSAVFGLFADAAGAHKPRQRLTGMGNGRCLPPGCWRDEGARAARGHLRGYLCWGVVKR
jgi:4-diphosphocytidyl-2C-methyl-D-erythritol kinase